MSGRVPGHPGRQVLAPRRTGLAALRFAAANNMLNLEYARLAARFLWRRLLTAAGRRWRTDGMLFLGPRLQLQTGRNGQIRFGRFVWIGHGTQDPLPRGDRRDRREDRDRPGVHDLRLPAGQHRPAVRDRRPGHVHRLRPQRRRSRAADPQAGHLQARRRRRLERLDRLRRPDPPRRHRRRQRDHRRQLRRHPRHPRQRGRRRHRRPGSSACAPRRSACSWPDPVEPEGYGPAGPR